MLRCIGCTGRPSGFAPGNAAPTGPFFLRLPVAPAVQEVGHSRARQAELCAKLLAAGARQRQMFPGGDHN